MNTRRSLKLTNQLHIHRPLSRILSLTNRDQLSIIEKERLFADEYRWQLFIPRDGYRLLLKTRSIPHVSPDTPINNATLVPEASSPLSPGMHEVDLGIFKAAGQFDQAPWIVIVRVDGVELQRIECWPNWNEQAGATARKGFDEQAELPVGQDAVLLHTAFRTKVANNKSGSQQMMSSNASGKGIYLWIQSPQVP